MHATQLTQQENAFADILVALLRDAEDRECKAAKFATDTEQSVLECYGKSKGAGVGVGQILACVNSILAENQRCKREAISRLAKKDDLPPPDMPPPAWFMRMNGESAKVMHKLADRNEKVYPVVFLLLMAKTTDDSFPGMQTFEDAKVVLEDIAGSANDADSLLNGFQQSLRKSLRANAEQTKDGRVKIFNAIKAWASGSEAKREYLKGKGVALLAEILTSPTSSRCSPAPAPRNGRQKTQTAPAEISVEQVSEERPWTVVCVNPQGTVLASLQTQMSDDGLKLAEVFGQCYKWRPSPRRAINALRRFLTSTDGLPWTTVDGVKWYNLKKFGFGNRVFALLNNETHKIFLMLAKGAKRQELYVHGLGRRHDES